MERHKILGDKVALYRRTKGGNWHAATFLERQEWRQSTKEKSLAKAKDVATDWYMDLCGKAHYGALQKGKDFADMAEVFTKEYEATTQGHRSPKWVQSHKDRLRLRLLPRFGDIELTDIKSGSAQEYRVDRMTKPKDWDEKHPAREWKPPARKTLHNEIVTLSMVLKTAVRHGWIEYIPDLSDPYRRQSKVEHRPWFTPKEYKQLYEATRKNAAEPKRPRYKWYAEQLHDYILFMANTGLRPDEARVLQFRDAEIVKDDYSGENILEIEVRGKRGVGFCKSMPGAVRPFERLRDRERSIKNDAGEAVHRVPKPDGATFS